VKLSKNWLQLTIAGTVFIGLVLCSVFIFTFSSLGLSPVDPTPLSLYVAPAATAPKMTKVVYGLPVRLKIPAINVDASLDYVNLTTSGELGAPTTPAHAAWYDQGPRPGEKGNSIIDGHYGWVNNIPAVFDSLNKVHQGDNLYVQDDHNVTTAFVVTNVQTLGESQSTKDVFVSKDDKAHLNLITCSGTWNQTGQSYSKRLVVFADKI
jgi:LPXTG-site transpeptidase (sortase) family protein